MDSTASHCAFVAARPACSGFSSTGESRMSDQPECAERDRLLREVEQSIRNLVKAPDVDANAALEAWRNAREAYMRHIEEHGC